MPKDIKIKEKANHSIRKLDRSVAFTSRVKRSMSEQYDKLKKEDNNAENSNATNYATTKIMRTGDRGARESAYVISGVSKNAYNKTKMKLAENRTQERLNNIKTRNSSMEIIPDTRKTSEIKNYQKKKLIKEKEGLKNIKKHNYKDVGIKTNNNSLKIKTRDTLKNTQNVAKNRIKIHTPNDLMKKSKLQNIKQNSIRIKKVAQKTEKAVVNVAKKVIQRAKRNSYVNSIWRRYCFSNTYYYFTNCWNVWLFIWILIL